MIIICRHGTVEYVRIINKDQNRNIVPVDACIAQEIQELNEKGIITLGCCCSHGKAGHIKTIDNGFMKWRTFYPPPNALIKEESVEKAIDMGYLPFPYHYINDGYQGVWQMQLKTGCITEKEVEEWHQKN